MIYVILMKINAISSNLPSYAGISNNAKGDYTKKVALKNSPFFNCILKINNQLIEDALDLDIVNPMYNLLCYSKNFKKTAGSFWNYYPDKPNSGCIVQHMVEMIMFVKEQKCFTQSKFQKVLIIIN